MCCVVVRCWQILVLPRPFRDFTVWIQGVKFVTRSIIFWLWKSLEQQITAIRYVTTGSAVVADGEIVIRSQPASVVRHQLLEALTRRFAVYTSNDEILRAMFFDPRFRHLPWVASDVAHRIEQEITVEELRYYSAIDEQKAKAAAAAGGPAAAAAAAAAVVPPAIAAAPAAAQWRVYHSRQSSSNRNDCNCMQSRGTRGLSPRRGNGCRK